VVSSSTSVPALPAPGVYGGSYTADEVASLDVYGAVLASYCADPQTQETMREWLSVDNVTAQVVEEYGFTITRATAEELIRRCA
jgi:hypothetical protein